MPTESFLLTEPLRAGVPEPGIVPVPNATGHRLPELDGLRGLAGLLVLFHHTLQVPTGGFLGVDLFFVLSGFLISSLLLTEITRRGVPRFGHFYRRRATRLLPAFCCMILLYLGLRFCFGPQVPWIGPRQALAVLLLSDIHVVTPYLGHAWSLSVEWQFYFVWPFVMTAMARAGLNRSGIASVALLGVLALWVLEYWCAISLRVDGLLLGSALPAAIGRPWFRRTAACHRNVVEASFWLAFVGFLALSFLASYPAPWMGRWVYSLAAILGALIVGTLLLSHAPLTRRSLGNPVMVHFGRISYGLYLYHFPIAAFMFVRHFSPLAMMVVGVTVSVALADCSWRYLEAPLLRLHRTS